MLEQNTHPASLEAWGSRHQTRQRVSGVSGVRVASEPVVAISIVAKSYHGLSEPSSLRSLTLPYCVKRLVWLLSNMRIQNKGHRYCDQARLFSGFYMKVL